MWVSNLESKYFVVLGSFLHTAHVHIKPLLGCSVSPVHKPAGVACTGLAESTAVPILSIMYLLMSLLVESMYEKRIPFLIY